MAKKVLKPVETGRIAEVPPQDVATGYIHRDVHGVHDFDLFDYAFKTGTNVLLFGETGPGKTRAIRAWAAHNGKPFYRVPSSAGIEPSHLFGKYIPDEENGGFSWFDGPATDILRNGGVLLIDEINFTPERISPILFPVLDDDRAVTLLDHQNEVIRAHRPNCWCGNLCSSRWVFIAATMNPQYAGTRPLNAALRNRFGMQIEWNYDDAVEEQLVQLPAMLRLARNHRRNDRRITPFSTNMLQEFQRIALEPTLGYQFAVGNLLAHFTPDERSSLGMAINGAEAEIKAEIADLMSETDADMVVNSASPTPVDPDAHAIPHPAPATPDEPDPFAAFR